MRMLVILLAGLFASAGPAPAQQASTAVVGEVGCIYDASGTLEKRKHGETGWKPLFKGSPLAQGDAVRTGAKAWCEILFKDGTFIKLEENSEAAAETLVATANERVFSFSFLKGKALWMAMKLKTKVTSKFQVKTPTVVCAVRGTDFSMLVAPSGETSLGLFDGVVALSGAGGEKTLQAGSEASAGSAQIETKDRFSGLMRLEERRYQRIKKRVEDIRTRLAEREDFIDDFINRQDKKLSDFESRRQEKLKKR